MYIEDRYFSESEDEVLYSVVLDEEDLRLYSEFCECLYGDGEKKKKKKIPLSEIESHRGLGRSAAIGLLNPVPGSMIGSLAGGYAGKKAAEKEDRREGSTAESIRSAAGKKGALVGGATAAGLGALTVGGLSGTAGHISDKVRKGLGKIIGKEVKSNLGWKMGAAGALGGGLIAGASGALGGYAGARKNAHDRIEKRRLLRAIAEGSDLDE